MKMATRVATTAGTFVVAGVAATLLNGRQRSRRRERRGEEVAFGSVHTDAHVVIASDGVPLHVEVDEGPDDRPTIVFVHGWVCTVDSWHYQRLALRDEYRMVFVDLRSHGSSGRSYHDNSSLEQLADDLKVVIESVVPSGPVVMVGHSMGGMAVIELAAVAPELFGTRITGVVLIATSAGRLMRNSPGLQRLVPLLRVASPVLDWGRAFNSYSVVRRWGLGPKAHERHVDMTNEMILRTPTHVLMDFHSNFVTLDLVERLPIVGRAATVVVCGTEDLLTPIKHSRRLAKLIPGAELVEIEGAGHMVLLEENVKVTGAIEDLVKSVS